MAPMNPFITSGPGADCGDIFLPGCGTAGHFGFGLTDVAGAGVSGYQAWGNYGSESGRLLNGAGDLTAQEARVAGQRMAYLRWNQGAEDAGDLGRSGFMQAAGWAAVGVSGVLNTFGYRSQGYGWGAAVAKSLVETTFSATGAYLGGAGGGFLGALVPGFDLTGAPEVAGAVGGAAAGGWLGGEVGSGVADLIPNF
jgi:hypothetical protein